MAADTIRFIVTVAIVIYKGLIPVVYRMLTNQYHKHIVLQGDNLWKISRRFYGTGTRYTDIAKWNNMSIDANIAPGDTILIK